MLSSPVGVVTDLDGTVVFGGDADPRLVPFLKRAAGREDISVVVATSRAPRGVVDVCAAGVDKSACMGLLTGEEALTSTVSPGGADSVEGAAVLEEPPVLRHRPASTWVVAGNDANDAAMLRAADIGVIVGDGLEGVRRGGRRFESPRAPARWCPSWSDCLS